MFIHCTKKLLDHLKIKVVGVQEGEPLFSWNMNLITINRKKTLVLVNDKNRFVVVLHGVKAKEFKNLDEVITDAIRISFKEVGIRDEVIEQYIRSSEEFTYTKTKDRKGVARLNKACENVEWFMDRLDSDSIFQPKLSQMLSDMLVGDFKSYFKPTEQMYKDLEDLTNMSVIRTSALQVKVTLKLENHKVWRRLVIPSRFTFEELHKALQIAFGWKNSHLYEFFIFYNPNSTSEGVILIKRPEGFEPIAHIVCTNEFDFDRGIPMKVASDVKLSDYDLEKIQYNYDFGDGWEHIIEVEEVLEDYSHDFPVCLDGEGNGPPEDIGGEGGYEFFLEAYHDPSHSEHEMMVNFARLQKYKSFSKNDVNRNLRQI